MFTVLGPTETVLLCSFTSQDMLSREQQLLIEPPQVLASQLLASHLCYLTLTLTMCCGCNKSCAGSGFFHALPYTCEVMMHGRSLQSLLRLQVPLNSGLGTATASQSLQITKLVAACDVLVVPQALLLMLILPTPSRGQRFTLLCMHLL